jgi:hypothetical protein
MYAKHFSKYSKENLTVLASSLNSPLAYVVQDADTREEMGAGHGICIELRYKHEPARYNENVSEYVMESVDFIHVKYIYHY